MANNRVTAYKTSHISSMGIKGIIWSYRVTSCSLQRQRACVVFSGMIRMKVLFLQSVENKFEFLGLCLFLLASSSWVAWHLHWLDWLDGLLSKENISVAFSCSDNHLFVSVFSMHALSAFQMYRWRKGLSKILASPNHSSSIFLPIILYVFSQQQFPF